MHAHEKIIEPINLVLSELIRQGDLINMTNGSEVSPATSQLLG